MDAIEKSIKQAMSEAVEESMKELTQEIIIQVSKDKNETKFHFNDDQGEAKHYTIETIQTALEQNIITKSDLKDILEQHSDETLIIAEVDHKGQAKVSLEYQDIKYIVGLVSGIISAIAYQERIDAIHILEELMRVEKEVPVDIQTPKEVAQ